MQHGNYLLNLLIRSCFPNRSFSVFSSILLGCLLAINTCFAAYSNLSTQPLYAKKTSEKFEYLKTILEKVPPLENRRGERWPLVLWHGVGHQPLTVDQHHGLLQRGIVQHIRLNEAGIATAQTLSQAGVPVIIMEGRGGFWPYDSDTQNEWRLPFEKDKEIPAEWKRLPDPTRFLPWQLNARHIKQKLEKFRASGIEPDAVWLDYEGALLHDDYDALIHSRSSSRLPDHILQSKYHYQRYRRKHWLEHLSYYLAAPVLSIFPNTSVTNWVVVFSTANHSTLSWTNWEHPPSPPLAFTHSNPVAYAIDTYFLNSWPEGHPITRENVDRFFTHLLLRQISIDALNRNKYFPRKGAIAWVGRWVRDHHQEQVPMMSREAYREALRHIWLRGVDGMQVFNSVRKNYEHYALYEVLDAQQIYDEMLKFAEFLNHGEVMNYDIPDNQNASILWSGMRLKDQALVRVTNLGSQQDSVKVCPWENRCFDLSLSEGNRSWILKR